MGKRLCRAQWVLTKSQLLSLLLPLPAMLAEWDGSLLLRAWVSGPGIVLWEPVCFLWLHIGSGTDGVHPPRLKLPPCPPLHAMANGVSYIKFDFRAYLLKNEGYQYNLLKFGEYTVLWNTHRLKMFSFYGHIKKIFVFIYSIF